MHTENDFVALSVVLEEKFENTKGVLWGVSSNYFSVVPYKAIKILLKKQFYCNIKIELLF